MELESRNTGDQSHGYNSSKRKADYTPISWEYTKYKSKSSRKKPRYYKNRIKFKVEKEEQRLQVSKAS
jgi:hypothetical protein